MQKKISSESSSLGIAKARRKAPAKPRLGPKEIISSSFPVVSGLATAAGLVMLFTVGINAVDAVLFLSFYVLCSLGVHAGYHRLFSHGSFKTHRPLRCLLAALGSMAAQGPVIAWCAIHRRHHQLSDTPQDPHTPNHSDTRLRGFLHAQMGWLYSEEFRGPQMLNTAALYAPDLLQEGALRAISRWYLPILVLGVVLPGVLGGLITGGWMGFWTGMFWGGFVRAFLNLSATQSINSLGHLFGSRPYRSQDLSTNNCFVTLVTLGEGWHNNHHAFPNSAWQGLRWWQVDPQAYFIWSLKAVGLARDLKRPSEEQIGAKAVS